MEKCDLGACSGWKVKILSEGEVALNRKAGHSSLLEEEMLCIKPTSSFDTWSVSCQHSANGAICSVLATFLSSVPMTNVIDYLERETSLLLCWRPGKCDGWSCGISGRKGKERGNGGIPQGAICRVNYQRDRGKVDFFFCGLILPDCSRWANKHAAFQDCKKQSKC